MTTELSQGNTFTQPSQPMRQTATERIDSQEPRVLRSMREATTQLGKLEERLVQQYTRLRGMGDAISGPVPDSAIAQPAPNSDSLPDQLFNAINGIEAGIDRIGEQIERL